VNHPDDDLRARLRRLDPAGDLPVDPVSSPRAAASVERAMQTLEPPAAASSRPSRSRPSRRTRLLAAAAGAGAAAAVTAGVLFTGGGEEPEPADAPTTLTLDLPASDTMASCAIFDVAVLAEMSPAFAGTVVEADSDSVLLEVDRWYAGGGADRVELAARGGDAVALGYGVDFAQGERYLVTASQGTVNGCGYSGPATPEFERSFDQAFGG
jgi:hypothetical protein